MQYNTGSYQFLSQFQYTEKTGYFPKEIRNDFSLTININHKAFTCEKSELERKYRKTEGNKPAGISD